MPDSHRLTLPSRALLIIGAIVLCVCLGIGLFLSPKNHPSVQPEQAAQILPSICKDVQFEDVSYIICTVDLRVHRIKLALGDSAGKPFGKLEPFLASFPADKRPLMAMNAGMYESDLSAVGLHIEDFRTVSPLNVSDGTGNYFMKPNGVFYVDQDGTAGLLTTESWSKTAVKAQYATQSGPMLVIDSAVHPRFEPNGSSKNVRNGVGIIDRYTVVFAISRQPVSFGSFARLFKDGLQCSNALYLDGTISTFSNGRDILVGGKHPVGPIISVFAIDPS